MESKKQLERAIELVDKYKPLCGGYWGGKINKEFAKQSAIIAVNEIMNLMYESGNRPEFTKKYWQEVKQEIEKL